MKQTSRLPGLFLLPISLCLTLGCSSMSNTDKGAVGGGLIGAGTGAAIGHALGNTGAGAVLGTGVGLIAGGLTGNAIDKAEHKADVAQAKADALTAQAQRQLGITDVVALAQHHTSDAIIIQQIRTTGSVYNLSPSDIGYLKANGVSDPVVIEMQATANRPVRRVYNPAPVYIYDPPPPPVSVGFGVGYYHPRRCGW